MEGRQTKLLQILCACLLWTSLIECGPGTDDPPAQQVSKKDRVLIVAVSPELVMRSGPGLNHSVVATIPAKANVTVEAAREHPQEMQRILGLEGNWAPVRYGSHSGWVFRPLLRRATDTICYHVERSVAVQRECKETQTAQPGGCLRFSASDFPQAFSEGCTNFGFSRGESNASEDFHCNAPYITTLNKDGSVSRSFQQHEGWSGTWTKTGQAITVSLRYWVEDCQTGCSYGPETNSPEWKECVSNCKARGGGKNPPPQSFTLKLDATGRMVIARGGTLTPVCFKKTQ